MGYTNSIATIKWWDPHTNKLKYYISVIIYKHNNNFGKVWSPGSNILKIIDTSSLLTIKMYLSDHLFVKYDIFEATVKFPPRGTPIVIITYYCDNNKMT